MSKYTLTVVTDDNTRKRLENNNFSLIVYKGMYTESGAGDSTIWIKIPYKDMQNELEIKWDTDEYRAFFSKPVEVVEKKKISVTTSDSKKVQLGDTLIRTERNEIEFGPDGKEGVITINNRGTAIHTGLSAIEGESVSGHTPICAVDLPGHGTTKMIPREKLLIFFSAEQELEPGLIISTTKTEAVTIDYFENVTEHRVRYNYETGVWAPDEKTVGNTQENGFWLNLLKTGVNITKHLIESI